MSDHTRLNINLNTESADYLRSERDSGTTATETIRRAISVYKFWRDTERSGGRLQIVSSSGEITEVKILV